MKVIYTGTNEKIIECVSASNVILGNEDLYRRIALHPQFDFTDERPADIAQWFRASEVSITVKLYKSRNPFSSATAYVSPQYPDTVFINSRKLDRSTADIVNTIIHECVHALDESLTGHRFGHGDNDSAGKGNSAPYWIGALAERIIRGSGLEDDSTIHRDELEFVEESETIDEESIID